MPLQIGKTPIVVLLDSDNEYAYNPANKDRQIGFQPTRKLGRTYKEDDLTYNRNLLGHADIEKVVSEEKIRQLSRSIMDVLWFSLWNKAK